MGEFAKGKINEIKNLYQLAQNENVQIKLKESKTKELQELTGIPYQEIKKDIFNLTEDDADLSKEPFSKLIHDISEELGLK